jgi:hypothetical protein
MQRGRRKINAGVIIIIIIKKTPEDEAITASEK